MTWRRKWQPTPVLLPRKFHGWKSLVGHSPWGRKESDADDIHIHIFIKDFPSELFERFSASNPTACSSSPLIDFRGLSDPNLSKTELLDPSPHTCSCLSICHPSWASLENHCTGWKPWRHPWLLCLLFISHPTPQYVLVTRHSEYNHFVHLHFSSSQSSCLPGLVSATTCQLGSLLPRLLSTVASPWTSQRDLFEF